jgi:FlaA1/EpsC-like NDP-sugar epimerase
MSILEHEIVRRAANLKSNALKGTQRRLFIGALVILDGWIVLLAFALAYIIRFQSSLPFFRNDASGVLDYYIQLSIILLPVWLVLFFIYRLYDFENLLGGLREYSGIFNATITGVALMAIAQFFSESLVLARGWVGLSWVTTFVLVSIGRFLARRVGYALRKRGYLMEQALIVGVNSEAELLGNQLLEWPTSGLNLLGYLDDQANLGKNVTGGLKVVGRISVSWSKNTRLARSSW